MKLGDWKNYENRTNSIPWLRSHRDWIEEHEYGFGDRSLHYMWYEIIKMLPNHATALEIGVYKGQIISLWGLIAKRLKKKIDIYGIVPLENAQADKYHTHEPIFLSDIQFLLDTFKTEATIIDGDSTDPELEFDKPLDLLFIDGGHNRETVESDVARFVPLVKKGGIVVFDDASFNQPDFGHWFKGLEDPSDVCDEFAKTHEEFLRVGYDRAFYV